MRPFLSFVVLALLAAPAGRAAAPEKPATDAPSETTAKPAWKIHRFSLTRDGAQLSLDETATGRPLLVKSSSTGDTRLLSVNFSAESNELHAEVLIRGVRHSLVQKASELAKAPQGGPTDDDRKRYEGLSDAAREKFREQLRATFADPQFRNAPEKERRSTVRAIFEKIEKEDQTTR